MVGVGPQQGANADYQRDPMYGLPNLNQPGKLSIGIYWQSSSASAANMEPLGYKSTAVKDPSGTILLCENTSGQQCAGNIWTCICNGPQWASPNELYQTDNSPPQDPSSGSSVNQGLLLYKAHRMRFNYVFNDGHVETLKIEQTIGTGTMTAPKGMWTAVMGD
jgi:prepilin-type processing-associated H-X9-DG protein